MDWNETYNANGDRLTHKEEKMELKVYQDAGLGPEGYNKPGDAGIDLRSADECSIAPGKMHWVSRGISCAIPEGHFGMVVPRSGLGSKGVTLENCVGIIDAGFRGTIKAKVRNDTGEDLHIHRGDRVMQMVIVPFVRCDIKNVSDPSELGESERGTDGYGSSGIN